MSVELEEQTQPTEETRKLLENVSVKPLGRGLLALYSMASLGVDISGLVVGFFFATFLLEVAKLNPEYTGTVFLLGQITDAISAPVVGKLSDNTNTNFGRRRPWMIFSAIPFGIVYVCMWQTWKVVENSGQGGIFAYYATIYVLYNIVGNLISVPFAAITPDLVTSYDHTTKLTEWKVATFTVVGIVVMVITSSLVEHYKGPDEKKGYSISSLIWGLASLLLPIVSGCFLRAYPSPPSPHLLHIYPPLVARIQDQWENCREELERKCS
eukprot:TRINITY_DN2228_c0_g1_i17.p1 TRINITY_DN2228_c0_g1~~TRINITY_DN2228_c0_g1_i17.p1  ORF type:complete len:281 (+),score=53.74 TRINITY_DN2228_c0_g1_i17:41-844(+)